MTFLNSFKYKLLISLTLLSIGICATLATFNNFALKKMSEVGIKSLITTHTEEKRKNLESWFEGISNDVIITANNPIVGQSLASLTEIFQGIGPDATSILQDGYILNNPHPKGSKQLLDQGDTGTLYDSEHAAIHSFFLEMSKKRGYYDIFLVNTDGSVVYSVHKETDFAADLINSPLSDTGLAEVALRSMQSTRGKVVFSQYAPYLPSDLAPAAFLATPVFGRNGKLLGSLAIQIPTNRLSAELQSQEWMGEDGKLFLVDTSGRLNSDLEKKFEKELLEFVTITPAVQAAIEGNRTFFPKLTGVNGGDVVAYSTTVNFGDLAFGLVSETEYSLVYKTADDAATNMTLISLALAGFSVICGAIMTQSFSSPLLRLQTAMSDITEGRHVEEIPEIRRKDEFGNMAQKLLTLRNWLIEKSSAEEQQMVFAKEQTQAVEGLSHALQKLRKGDLTFELCEAFAPSYDRLRLDYNKSIETLNHAMAQVVEASDSIRRGSLEITHASDDLSNRTENQAATLEQTAAALDELTASVKSAAEGALSVEKIVSQAKQEATQSGEVVRSAVRAMNKIEGSSEQISQIIGVIDDIAFQTNLLALNAGVEAARAGDSGKGFSVVASEVRALAQRSSEAAHQIKTLISGSTHQVEHGVELVGKAGDALESIVERVNHISSLVSDIASGATEQSAGLGEINVGVNQLDQVTQQNAAMVEQVTAASHILQKDTSSLSDLVEAFNLRNNSIEEIAPSHESRPKEENDETPELVHAESINIPPKPLSLPATGSDDDGWQDF